MCRIERDEEVSNANGARARKALQERVRFEREAIRVREAVHPEKVTSREERRRQNAEPDNAENARSRACFLKRAWLEFQNLGCPGTHGL
jgi:hypothetical protein